MKPCKGIFDFIRAVTLLHVDDEAFSGPVNVVVVPPTRERFWHALKLILSRQKQEEITRDRIIMCRVINDPRQCDRASVKQAAFEPFLLPEHRMRLSLTIVCRF